MDSRTGDIYNVEEFEKFKKRLEKIKDSEELKHFIPLTDDEYNEFKPLDKKVRKNKMRNKLCLCGSGKKFKNCCWSKYT